MPSTMKIAKKLNGSTQAHLPFTLTQFRRPALITGALLVRLHHVGWWVGNRAGLRPSTGHRA